MIQRSSTARNIALAISLAAILLVYFFQSPWTALAVPVVWFSAYCFGWYEGRDG